MDGSYLCQACDGGYTVVNNNTLCIIDSDLIASCLNYFYDGSYKCDECDTKYSLVNESSFCIDN